MAEWHPESVEEIPRDLDWKRALVTMEDVEGNRHSNFWDVAEYRGCFVLTDKEIESAIVAEPGAKLTVTYLPDMEDQL